MESCSEDGINRLPDALLGHILSYLSTKEAASTSVLSKRWRYLLAFVPNLELDDSVYLHPERRVEIPLKVMGEKRKKLSTSFPDFVDRILDLQHKYRLKKLFLKVVDDHDPVDPDCVNPWIHNALSRGVSDLHLVIDLNWASNLTPRIFLTETLVKLRIHIRNGFADVESVYLPKLKVLHLEPVRFEIEKDVEFHRLFSGCPVLEELVLDDIWSCEWASFSVSVTTLKRLRSICKLIWEHHEVFPTSVSFDTPNLVYLDYTEVLADQYPKVRFDSLVEAKIDLLISKAEFTEDDEDNDVFGNATDFVMGISNVQKLELSASTLKVLTFCCKAIPIFKNLTHLTIWSKPEVGWESLPGLLKNCPKLETLFLIGLCHKATDRCGDVCLCNREEKAEDFVSCLSSSRVKVLKICTNGYEVEKQKEQINHFLATMPHLEQVVVYYNKDLTEMSTQLQMLTTAASQKCKVRLISVDLNLRRFIPVDLNLASSARSTTAL